MQHSRSFATQSGWWGLFWRESDVNAFPLFIFSKPDPMLSSYRSLW